MTMFSFTKVESWRNGNFVPKCTRFHQIAPQISKFPRGWHPRTPLNFSGEADTPAQTLDSWPSATRCPPESFIPPETNGWIKPWMEGGRGMGMDKCCCPKTHLHVVASMQSSHVTVCSHSLSAFSPCDISTPCGIANLIMTDCGAYRHRSSSSLTVRSRCNSCICSCQCCWNTAVSSYRSCCHTR